MPRTPTIPIPESWRALGPPTAQSDNVQAPRIALAFSDSGSAAARLREAGLTTADVFADLLRGVVIRRRSPEIIDIFSTEYKLLVAQSPAKRSGQPTLFVRAIDPPGENAPAPVWRPADVEICPPWAEQPCDASQLLAYQERTLAADAAMFGPPSLPTWLTDRSALASKLEGEYGPLRVLLQTLRDRNGLGQADAVSGKVLDIGHAEDADEEPASALVVIELSAETNADDLDAFVQGTKVEVQPVDEDGNLASSRLIAELKQVTRDRLWFRCRSTAGLLPQGAVRLKAMVDFDKKHHQFALNKFLGGAIAGNWSALASLLTDPAQLKHHHRDDRVDLNISAGLDADQRAAVEGAVNAPHAFLIQGPPGTGKTTVIAEIIRQCTARGERVLLVAQQHSAVDNVLDHLKKSGSDGVLSVRLASKESRSKVHRDHQDKLSADPERYGQEVLFPEKRRAGFIDARQPQDQQQRVRTIRDSWFAIVRRADTEEPRGRSGVVERIGEEILDCINLICSTTTGIGGNLDWREQEFDTLILDEASRVTDAEFLIGAVRSRRWILVGDENQLPPHVNHLDEHYVHAILALRNAGDSPDEKGLRTSVYDLARAWEEEDSERRFRADSVFQLAWRLVQEGHWPRPCREHADRLVQRCDSESTDGQRGVLRLMIDALQGSLFARATAALGNDPRFVKALTRQRRSVREIAELVNAPVYQGRYCTPDDNDVQPLLAGPFNAPVTFIDTAPYGPRAFDTQRGTGFVNECEQAIACEVLRTFAQSLRQAGRRASVSVLSTYKAQVESILKRLEAEAFIHPARTLPVSSALKFETFGAIDRVQGRESDLVILSFCRARPQRPTPDYGLWLQDLRRLNVAVTRARRALVLIGHLPTLSQLGSEGSAARRFYDHLFGLVQGGTAGYSLTRVRLPSRQHGSPR